MKWRCSRRFLAGIITPDAAAFGALDALTVDHAGRECGLAPLEFAGNHHQIMVHGGKQAAVAPVKELAPHCLWRWEIPGQK